MWFPVSLVTMSAPCTFSKTLSVISQKLKRKRDPEMNTSPSKWSFMHACISLHTKFELPSFTRSKDMMEPTIKKGHVTLTTPTCMDGLSSVGLNLLRSVCLPNFKSLSPSVPKTWMATQNVTRAQQLLRWATAWLQYGWNATLLHVGIRLRTIFIPSLYRQNIYRMRALSYCSTPIKIKYIMF